MRTFGKHGLVRAALGAAALMLAAPTAQAQDRVSLGTIDRKLDDVLAAQNQGAIPIFACTTIDTPGFYVVVQNLTAAGDCLFVTADNVNIDLGGHVLSGDGTGDGVTSDASDDFPKHDIAVRNGTLSGFANGVELTFVESVVVENVRAVGCAMSGFLIGSKCAVRGNVVRNSGGDGLQASSECLVADNTVSLSGGNGISAGSVSAVTGNIVSNNRGDGISTFRSTITGNSVSGSSGFGIKDFGGSTIAGNTMLGNGGGIRGAARSTITGNTATDNRGDGITGGPFGTIAGNTSASNQGDGFVVDRGSTVRGNTAADNTVNGLNVTCPSNVIANTATGNTVANLVLTGAGCQSIDNLAP